DNSARKKSEQPSKRAKSRGPVQRDTKEVLAELVGKLKEKLDPKKVAATSAGEQHERGELRPNLDRLTVRVDLGDRWSNYCILDLEGEAMAEGQLRTTQQDFAEFFQSLSRARVGDRGGDTLGLGGGSHRPKRTRSGGGESAVDGGIEASQA